MTSISLDHTSILGSTLRQVAQEKAGIIKPGSVVVSAPQASEAEEVIRQTCRERDARLLMLGEDVCWQRLKADLEGQTLQVRTPKGDHRLWIPLLGKFQCENATLAVAAIEEARSLGVEVSSRSVAQGLRNVSWPGRLQVLRRQPLLVVDGAHNEHSAAVLRKTVQEDLTFQRCILVVGTSIDKDIAGIAWELAPLADVVVATQSHHPRSAPPTVVAGEFTKLGKETHLAEDVPSAMAAALGWASPGDLVLATGSLFVVAEALEWAGQYGPS
ncbi:MAG: cyanophycin synthetase [Dehalococcoidia bacterium]|nr:cyanophycin synthetase [Dehalococcoidia bacterium]